MPPGIRIRREILDWLSAEALRSSLEECCGLLAGVGGVITAAFPARNALASPMAFEIAPENLFAIFRSIRAGGLEHLGIYHSHPAGPDTPSPTDVDRADYPDVAYFILSPRADEQARIRSFSIRDGGSEELTIEPV